MSAQEMGPHAHDLPDHVLSWIFSFISDVRTRNSTALVCQRWRLLERLTRSSLALRGHARDLYLLPTCFPSVDHLDLSLLSPWGHPLASGDLVAARLRRAFPSPSSLVLYARSPETISAVVHVWAPSLVAAKLVRWHRRPPDLPHGADLHPILASCPNLKTLDLSSFYCWTEDIPAALGGAKAAAAKLTYLDVLFGASADGFRSGELAAVAAACPSLTTLLAPCAFNPRLADPVGDETLAAVASACPDLRTLHLADPFAVSPSTAPPVLRGPDGFSLDDSRVSKSGLETLFAALPHLFDLSLDVCFNVRDSGPAMETIAHMCPAMKTLKIGAFHDVCKGIGLHLDGLAVCGGLRSLAVKNSVGFTNASLAAVARGCALLEKFEIDGCDSVTESGLKKFAGKLAEKIIDVRVSGCRCLDATRALRALTPLRHRLERLHVDCVWSSSSSVDETSEFYSDDDLETENSGERPSKRCRHSDCPPTWSRLRHLSIWIAAGELLWPLSAAGLENCPELTEIKIKVEGDCRKRPTERVFGLSSLSMFTKLRKMELDCGDATGYAHTAPTGQMDLSFWERFYLHGVGDLEGLYELDYWPPQDREVNQRPVSLPAAGLLQGCVGLRKLFIHGTAHEHFMRFFLQTRNLRDVQLREDYYPAPEDDMSTEMRVESCRRFEAALDRRPIPD